MIYLDYNATAPAEPAVVDSMLPYLRGEFGNPSSAHQLGSRARCAVEDGREQVAALLGAAGADVVFTSGGTESNNLAITGVTGMMASAGHVVSTAAEHASVLAPLRELERRGWLITRLPVDGDGRVSPDAVAAAIGPGTALVTIGWVNNEIGTVQAIEAIGALCRERGVPLHVDAAQALGKIPVRAGHVDLLSVSAHKIGGAKGVGALYVGRGVAIRPLLFGGPQERERRAGTENVAGIVGFGEACALATRNLERMPLIEQLRERLWDSVSDVPGIRRNSPRYGCAANTLNLECAGRRGDTLVAALDLRGIAVSSGAACAAGAGEPSHVLRAIGRDEDAARSAIRISLGWNTTAEEIDAAANALRSILGRAADIPRREAARA